MRALAITAAAVFVLLTALIIWFAVSPGPTADPDGPVITLAVTPPPKPEGMPEEPAASAPVTSPFELPPGFGITPPRDSQAPAPAPDTAAPGQPPVQLQSAPPMAPAPLRDARIGPIGPTGPAGGNDALGAAPVAELVEESRYGPLPKVAADGRKALDVYSRPSPYASKATLELPPRVALLVDGMGGADAETTELVMKLPAAVSLAYGAYTRDPQEGVDKARGAGHEVLLEVPLEPVDYPTSDPGPHTLLTSLPPAENMKRLQWLMSRFTGYVGVTNARGSKFVANRDSLLPVLEEIKSRGLLFVEDAKAEGSAGREVARVLGLSHSAANIRIDSLPGAEEIAKALSQLEALAKAQGAAIGVASAKPETIKQVADWAGQLDGKGLVLIPVSAAVRSQQQS